MHLLIHNRSLLRGMVAGAVALASASACSRSDRADTGRDTTQTGAVAPTDTHPSATPQSNSAKQPTTGTQPTLADTATEASTSEVGKAGSETATSSQRIRPSDSAVTAQDSTKVKDAESVSGYQAMGHDTSAVPRDTTASASVIDTSANAGAPTGTEMGGVADHVMADTSVTHEVTSDTANSGYAPMARDTSVELAQSDTTAQAQVDTSSQAQADTATIGDTAVILTQADTTQQAELAVGTEADTTAMANDSTAGQPAERVHPDTVSQKADELAKHEPARVRPPEDSTETLGHVTTDASAANADASAVGAAGVASTGNIATGEEAVGQMSRGGERCTVAIPEKSRDVQWDMASSPATLNPCGTGTMTLPRTWTGEKK
jgi:hypothetical protein